MFKLPVVSLKIEVTTTLLLEAGYFTGKYSDGCVSRAK